MGDAGYLEPYESWRCLNIDVKKLRTQYIYPIKKDTWNRNLSWMPLPTNGQNNFCFDIKLENY